MTSNKKVHSLTDHGLNTVEKTNATVPKDPTPTLNGKRIFALIFRILLMAGIAVAAAFIFISLRKEDNAFSTQTYSGISDHTLNFDTDICNVTIVQEDASSSSLSIEYAITGDTDFSEQGSVISAQFNNTGSDSFKDCHVIIRIAHSSSQTPIDTLNFECRVNCVLYQSGTLNIPNINIVADELNSNLIDVETDELSWVQQKGDLKLNYVTLTGTANIENYAGDTMIQSNGDFLVDYVTEESSRCMTAASFNIITAEVCDSVSTLCAGQYGVCDGNTCAVTAATTPAFVVLTYGGSLFVNNLDRGDAIDEDAVVSKGDIYPIDNNVTFDANSTAEWEAILADFTNTGLKYQAVHVELGDKYSRSGSFFAFNLVQHKLLQSFNPRIASSLTFLLTFDSPSILNARLKPGFCPYKPISSLENLYKAQEYMETFLSDDHFITLELPETIKQTVANQNSCTNNCEFTLDYNAIIDSDPFIQYRIKQEGDESYSISDEDLRNSGIVPIIIIAAIILIILGSLLLLKLSSHLRLQVYSVFQVFSHKKSYKRLSRALIKKSSNEKDQPKGLGNINSQANINNDEAKKDEGSNKTEEVKEEGGGVDNFVALQHDDNINKKDVREEPIKKQESEDQKPLLGQNEVAIKNPFYNKSRRKYKGYKKFKIFYMYNPFLTFNTMLEYILYQIRRGHTILKGKKKVTDVFLKKFEELIPKEEKNEVQISINNYYLLKHEYEKFCFLSDYFEFDNFDDVSLYSKKFLNYEKQIKIMVNQTDQPDYKIQRLSPSFLSKKDSYLTMPQQHFQKFTSLLISELWNVVPKLAIGFLLTLYVTFMPFLFQRNSVLYGPYAESYVIDSYRETLFSFNFDDGWTDDIAWVLHWMLYIPCLVSFGSATIDYIMDPIFASSRKLISLVFNVFIEFLKTDNRKVLLERYSKKYANCFHMVFWPISASFSIIGRVIIIFLALFVMANVILGILLIFYQFIQQSQFFITYLAGLGSIVYTIITCINKVKDKMAGMRLVLENRVYKGLMTNINKVYKLNFEGAIKKFTAFSNSEKGYFGRNNFWTFFTDMKLSQIFNKMNLDDDDCISYDEFKVFLRKIYGNDLTEHRCLEIFSACRSFRNDQFSYMEIFDNKAQDYILDDSLWTLSREDFKFCLDYMAKQTIEECMHQLNATTLHGFKKIFSTSFLLSLVIAVVLGVTESSANDSAYSSLASTAIQIGTTKVFLDSFSFSSAMDLVTIDTKLGKADKFIRVPLVDLYDADIREE